MTMKETVICPCSRWTKKLSRRKITCHHSVPHEKDTTCFVRGIRCYGALKSGECIPLFEYAVRKESSSVFGFLQRFWAGNFKKERKDEEEEHEARNLSRST